MAKKVKIMIRVRMDGSRRFCNVVTAKNGKLKPGYAMVNGKPEEHPEGEYWLRYRRDGKQQWDRVGPDAQLAVVEQIKRLRSMEAKAVGVHVVEPMKSGKRISDSITQYLTEKSLVRRKRTLDVYTSTLRRFERSCAKQYVEQIERGDLLSYIAELQASGLEIGTIYSQMIRLGTWLKWAGAVRMTKKELPQPTRAEPNAYSTDDLERLFAGADRETHELMRFYLGTGFRELEGVSASWADIDWERKTITVTAKPDLQFAPKDHEERVVPVPDSLLAMLRARRMRDPETRLIFPGKGGKRRWHALRDVKRIAFKAGLNCGNCIDKKGKSCKDHPVCGRIELHRFRRTFATRLAESGMPSREIQRLLGHSKLETTERYLAPLYRTQERTRALVNAAFDFGGPRLAATA